MSKSVLHDWECAIERISGNNANEMLDIAQDIYNTGYVRGKNAMLWVIEDIKAEIEKMPNRNPSYTHTCDVVDREDVLDIIDKHIGGE